VVDVKAKLSQFKSFWSSLPEIVCQDENVAARAEETSCWDAEKQDWNVSEAFDELLFDYPAVASTLRRAYNGYQTHDDDTSDEMSGSGSGSGCMGSCLPPVDPLYTENPKTEESFTSRLHPCNFLLLLLLLVLSILTSLDQQS
ncbi:glypican-6-like, partial [Tachysurus ichikawai]